MARRAGDHHAAWLEQRAEVLGVERAGRAHAATSTSASTAIGRPATTMSGLRSTLRTSGRAIGEVGEAGDHRDEGVAVDRRLAPELAEELLGVEIVDELVGVDRA